jgi:hypothetical protein
LRYSCINYLTVISYASEALTAARLEGSSSRWLSEFSESRSESTHKTQETTTLLFLLSASLTNKKPLPPYLKPPSRFHLFDQIIGTDPSILGLNNINEPGFRAFAVIEMAHMCLVDSTGTILKHVRELVGEINFSFVRMENKRDIKLT